MIFSSTIFIFCFLPLTLLLYFLTPSAWKNFTAFIVSLIFYAWGEISYTLVMLLSICVNYSIGIYLDYAHERYKKSILIFGLTINLMLLIAFKYINFITDNINDILTLLNYSLVVMPPVHLPLGISFFTFHAISYLVDIYRRTTPVEHRFINAALYITLFPQLVAGPIIRYHDVAEQIKARQHSLALFASGTERFIIGLAKKTLLANPLGELADEVFNLPSSELHSDIAWLGLLCYSLQIYFDFSGYSDMAIGLGRMLGFKFLENFNYPYIACSIQEFWRRWHISLSNWFRDYLYIPLGGNRVSPLRAYLNLNIVFFLCGLWHGASWNFIIWGMIHGLFLSLEKTRFITLLERSSPLIRHAYTLLIVMISWVFFRCSDFSSATHFLAIMFGITQEPGALYNIALLINNELIIALSIGIIAVTPIYPYIKNINPLKEIMPSMASTSSSMIFYCSLLILSLIKISAGTYNPFIYFRF
ncbi:MAG: MBOAT family O-acyltransferase [Methylococcaceae bacterium]